jgi:hypothetical protein
MFTTTVTYTTPGTITTIIPSGCSSVKVECYGGGGHGGSVEYAAGAGASGGCYSKTNSVICSPGQSIIIIVAAIRNWQAGTPINGNDSYVSINSVEVCRAKGGISANGNSPGIGSITGCIGDLSNPGGDGDSGLANSYSGGGGASGTTERQGGNADTYLGGVASGDINGLAGDGANGLVDPNYGTGYTGGLYGGGGSGGYHPYEIGDGGIGQRGAVKLTYTIDDQNMLLAFY